MQIAKKIFPYPIINRESQYSTYTNSSFSLELEEIDSEKIFYLKKVRYSTDSELLKKLINDKKVEVALIIECSETIYRKKIILNEEGMKLNDEQIKEVREFLYAIANIEYKYKNMQEEYGD